MALKQCGRCRDSKALEAFPIRRKSPDGRNPWCRDCYRVWYRARKETHIQQQADQRERNKAYWSVHDAYTEHPTGMKQCRSPHDQLPVTEFFKDATRTDGLTPKCKTCFHAKGRTTADKDAWVALVRNRPQCAYCGSPSAHVDHVIPIVRGGKDTATNYLPACATCNLGKNASWVYDWLLGIPLGGEAAKPSAYKTWDAVFIKELFHEIESTPDSSCPQ